MALAPSIRTTPMVASRRSTPVAAGFSFASLASVSSGPRPKKTSALLAPKVELPLAPVSKLISPSIVTKLPTFRLNPAPKSANSSPWSWSKLITRFLPPTVTVSSTAPPVVLKRRPTPPPSEKPPPATPTTPVTKPATPSSVMTIAPLPCSRLTPSVVAARSLTPTAMTLSAPAPDCSNVNLAMIDDAAAAGGVMSAETRPVAIRKYGPAGKAIPASSTRLERVLISMTTAGMAGSGPSGGVVTAVSEKPGAVTEAPGAVKEALAAEMLAATPSLVNRSVPERPVTSATVVPLGSVISNEAFVNVIDVPSAVWTNVKPPVMV